MAARKIILFFLILVLFSIAITAHTAYVLSHDELRQATEGKTTFWTLWQALRPTDFFFMAGDLALLVILARYFLFLKLHNRRVRGFFQSLEAHHAWIPTMLRAVLGLTLLVASSNTTLFAPDMPLATPSLIGLQASLGLLLLLGFATEIAAFITIILVLYGFASYGIVMLNHLEIAGTALLLLAWGGGRFSVNHVRTSLLHWLAIAREKIHQLRPHGVALLRWSVGLSFIVMGMREKLLQPSLSIAVVEKFGLAASFGVTPEFYVLGAGLVEVGLGLLLLTGFLTRFVGVIAFVVFTASMLFFGEDMVPHLLMMAIFLCFMVSGAQEPSVDRWLLRKHRRT